MKSSIFKLGILITVTMLILSGLNSWSKTTEEKDAVPAGTSADYLTENTFKDMIALSDEESLVFMREEEKMARDVYIFLYDKWELMVFDNISNSEQRHMDKVLELLVHFGIDDPALPGYGEFANEEIQELYNSLVASGETSVEEAIIAGATIEDKDIFDLQNFISETEDELIQCVCSNLVRASRNHLRAFARHLEMMEIEYTPQFLTQEEYDAIVSGSHEAGGTPCNFN